MSTTKISKRIFGGIDRIKRLRIHFNRILSSQNNVSIVLLFDNLTSLIVEILRRVRLHKYLNIVGNDKINTNNNIFERIIQLSNEHHLEMSKNILFIVYHVFFITILRYLFYKYIKYFKTFCKITSKRGKTYTKHFQNIGKTQDKTLSKRIQNQK